MAIETEEIVGAIIVLVIIIVIGLIVFNSEGGFIEDIKKIADEVFGWTKGQQIQETAKQEEAKSQEFMGRLVKIYEHSMSDKQKGCTYDTGEYNLAEKYQTNIEYVNGKEISMKFNLINKEDSRIINAKTITTKEKTIKPCFTEEIGSKQEGGERIDITYTSKEGMKAGTKEVYEELPKFYKFDENNLCFITKTNKEEEKYKKYFFDLKECETGKISGEEKSKNFFRTFAADINRCKASAPAKIEKTCQCQPIDFSKMPAGARIDIKQEKDELIMKLYYNNKEIGQGIEGTKIKTELAKEITEYFDTNPILAQTTETQSYTTDSGMMHMVMTPNKQLGMALTPKNVRKIWANEMPSCAPQYYGVSGDKCKQRGGSQAIMEKIQKQGYDKIIKETTQNPNERELLAAIMAAESQAENKARSDTECSGLMQFCASTAQGFSITKNGKTEYVCDPDGCNKQDNRNNPEITIPAALKLLKTKMEYIDKCANYKGENRMYMYREIFAIAAYNGGEGVICKAIKATKKEDPTWEEVKNEINAGLLQNLKDYSTWSDPKITGKIGEISCYPYHVQTYRTEYTGRFA